MTSNESTTNVVEEKNSQADAHFTSALAGQPWDARRRALLHVFEEIEPRYDRLNRWLSLGLDRGWRRWTARSLVNTATGPLLDLASGTGDLAVAFSKEPGLLGEKRSLLRADLSASLLRVGAGKLDPERARLAIACEMDRLPFRTASLAGVGQGFALRHCRDLSGFLGELYRVLKPGGRFAIIDMRYPRRGIAAGFYRWYFSKVLPRLAALLGGERGAYEFMVQSVRAFPAEEDLIGAARRAGFESVRSTPGFLGSVRLLEGRRPETGAVPDRAP